MGIYDDLNIQRVINAAGTLTAWGGSCLPPEVTRAMAEAAQCFASVRELQDKVQARLAELTHNPAAYVTCGCAAGLYLANAAAVCLHWGKAFQYVKAHELAGSKVLVYRAQRNPFDWAVRQLGVRLVEVGYPNEVELPRPEHLSAQIDQNTVAIFYTLSGWTARGVLPIDEVIAVGKQFGIPVIVDAAAQLPPAENLWKWTNMGASAVSFSGGKDLCGPQSSGLLVGQADFIAQVRDIGFPNLGIGRMVKVGRESMAGLLAAVERYLRLDHDARARWCEAQVQDGVQGLNGVHGLVAERSFPNEAGQPIPRLTVKEPGDLNFSERLSQALMEGQPPVAVLGNGPDGIFINPMTMVEGDMAIVVDQIKRLT